jgi:hypothetical protein
MLEVSFSLKKKKKKRNAIARNPKNQFDSPPLACNKSLAADDGVADEAAESTL